MAPITVEITAKAYDQGARLAQATGLAGDESPITFECQLSPQADSYGEAIVHALRKSADTAATRLGIVGDAERAVPMAVSRCIDEMCALTRTEAPDQGFPSQLVLGWARQLAAEYGLILTADAEQPGQAVEA